MSDYPKLDLGSIIEVRGMLFRLKEIKQELNQPNKVVFVDVIEDLKMPPRSNPFV